jgi:DNA-binding NarL/FixJ family response regulator
MRLPHEPGLTRVLLVDDHPVIRQGLTSLINEESDMKVCGEADNARDAIRAIEKLQPSLVITDVSLKGDDGIALSREIKARWTMLPIIVLSVCDEVVYAERALRAGARGYLMKSEPSANILTAIRRVVGGGIYVSDKSSARILQGLAGVRAGDGGKLLDQLTDREMQIFRYVGEGHSIREIAEMLCVSVKTVEAHRDHIKRKLNVDDSHQLLRCAIAHAKEMGGARNSARDSSGQSALGRDDV